ncbi:unnamed protein product [Nippostrongylus brasiliensis]|uniref:Hva1_TUDOR domain-containing protein n=1 Tax=Nippostrongylus brasiliensis TaxID=27835 RepID=A0A0N4Y2G4_NIPBR|nr:unnamed protein product [Nippostrongylus brasiliensis]
MSFVSRTKRGGGFGADGIQMTEKSNGKAQVVGQIIYTPEEQDDLGYSDPDGDLAVHTRRTMFKEGSAV